MFQDIIEKIEECAKEIYPSEGKITKIEIIEDKKYIYSEVLIVRIHFNQGTKTVAVKKYKRERGADDSKKSVEEEYAILKHLHSHFSCLKGLNVVKPLSYFPAENLLVTEKFQGEKLNSIIVKDLRWFPTAEKLKRIEGYFYKCGKWLNFFHSKTDKNKTIKFDQETFVEAIRKELKQHLNLKLKESFYQNIFFYIDETFKKIKDNNLRLVGYHADFAPWNILIDTDELIVLDFEMFSYGTIYDDITIFLAVVDSYKGIIGISGKIINKMRNAFIDGYGEDVIDRDLFNLFMLKNTLVVLNRINLAKTDNINKIDILYEKFRKKMSIRHHLKFINSLTNDLQ